VAKKSRHLTAAEQQRVEKAERRLAEHLDEVEKAYAQGRLAELIRDTPSVRDQLRRQDASA
jgi:hypothetical protein